MSIAFTPAAKPWLDTSLCMNCRPTPTPSRPKTYWSLPPALITGAPVTTATRYVVSARSPLTNGYGELEAAGYWGPELKMAGFEAIVVTGRAPEPVYLWLHDGQAEIRPARHLWGHDPDEVEASLRTELADNKIRVLQIGIGGENQVRYAAITNDLRHFNGRTGMGAVMGSKQLKAVAVRGHQRYQSFAHDPERCWPWGASWLVKCSPAPRALTCRSAAPSAWSKGSTRPACCRPETSARERLKEWTL